MPHASTTTAPKTFLIQMTSVKSMNAPMRPEDRARPLLDARGRHEQAADDARAEIAGGGDETPRDRGPPASGSA